MTAGPDAATESSTNAEQDQQAATATANRDQLPIEINKIFEFLSSNKKITFKSQQIDDPELQATEKIKIAHDIYAKSKHSFLMRFGGYLDDHHLSTFSRLCTANDSTTNEEQRNEMKLMLEDYRQRLRTRKLLVKNRRYAAMQKMLVKGDYFSELEMMKRAPELYDELVGQYMSEAEKKLRDGYDVRNTTFSGILMHTMEQRELSSKMQEVAEQNLKERRRIECSVGSSSSSEDSNEQATVPAEEEATEEEEVPVNCRQQWGNFDNEQQACSTSRVSKPKVTTVISKPVEQTYLTAGERDLLRNEFLGLMREQFLDGADTEFDYETVDNDSRLDDLQQLNQDKEDEYFEASDEEEGEDDDNEQQANASGDTESEDELDTYMRHLSNHHSLQS